MIYPLKLLSFSLILASWISEGNMCVEMQDVHLCLFNCIWLHGCFCLMTWWYYGMAVSKQLPCFNKTYPILLVFMIEAQYVQQIGVLFLMSLTPLYVLDFQFSTQCLETYLRFHCADMLHVFSNLSRNLNFIEHMQMVAGWKL